MARTSRIVSFGVREVWARSSCRPEKLAPAAARPAWRPVLRNVRRCMRAVYTRRFPAVSTANSLATDGEVCNPGPEFATFGSDPNRRAPSCRCARRRAPTDRRPPQRRIGSPCPAPARFHLGSTCNRPPATARDSSSPVAKPPAANSRSPRPCDSRRFPRAACSELCL